MTWDFSEASGSPIKMGGIGCTRVRRWYEDITQAGSFLSLSWSLIPGPTSLENLSYQFDDAAATAHGEKGSHKELPDEARRSKIPHWIEVPKNIAP